MTLLRIGRYIVDNDIESLKDLPYIPVLSKLPIPFVSFTLTDISWKAANALNADTARSVSLSRQLRRALPPS
jgi:hypothetical protein